MSGGVLFQERNGIRFRSLMILAARAPSSVNSGFYVVYVVIRPVHGFIIYCVPNEKWVAYWIRS